MLFVVFVLFPENVDASDQDDHAMQIQEAAIQSIHDMGKDYELLSFKKKKLIDNIYEYTMIVKTGKGEFDKIGIHRVVKVNNDGKIKKNTAVMMLHGDSTSFESSFLGSMLSDKVTKNHSIAIFLAERDIDVWGMDKRWVFIPSDTTNFSFMKNWGTNMNLDDAQVAVKIARDIRKSTDNSIDKIYLLGHSRGGALVYAYANKETQLQSSRRDLKGIIPVEWINKFDPQEIQLKQSACDRYNQSSDLYNNGIYYSNEGESIKMLSLLAYSDPDSGSPVLNGFSNKEAVLSLLSSTYALSLHPPVPYYHYLAGTFDGIIPAGLAFTNFGYVLDIALSSATPPFQSLQEIIEGESLWCDRTDLPYDDHLNEVKIPLLYVGAEGGFGKYAEYSTQMLGSKDKTTLVVQISPPDPLDYGHVDVLWADNSESLVWEPISTWIKNH